MAKSTKRPSKVHKRLKGKKAWRKNIDTTDVERGLQKATQEERQGLAFEWVDDSALFYEDKAPQPEAAPLPKKRAKQQQLLRSQIILQAPSSVRPVKGPTIPKPKGPLPKQHRGLKAAPTAITPQQHRSRKPAAAAEDLIDPWAEAPAASDPQFGYLPESIPGLHVKPPRRPLWQAGPIPAVEVAAGGCSYNPDPVQHQDAVAAAVAAEVKKGIAQQLRARAPPVRVDYLPESDPLALLQGREEQQPAEAHNAGARADDDAGPSQQQGCGRKKTVADRNRAKRGRAADAEAGSRAALKRQRQQLDGLGSLMQEVEAEQRAAAARAQRAQAVKAEKAATEPPRLGRLRFQEEPVQVLLSEEVTGSLRQVKAAPMLARERFKALQKRGVIEPRAATRRRTGRKVLYETGGRSEKAQARQDDVDDAKRREKKAK